VLFGGRFDWNLFAYVRGVCSCPEILRCNGRGQAMLSYDLLRVGCPHGHSEKWCQAQRLGYDGGADYVFAVKVNISRTS
jgi:hypothetical protein